MSTPRNADSQLAETISYLQRGRRFRGLTDHELQTNARDCLKLWAHYPDAWRKAGPWLYDLVAELALRGVEPDFGGLERFLDNLAAGAIWLIENVATDDMPSPTVH